MKQFSKIALSLLVVATLILGVATLSLSANGPTIDPKPANGNWEQVCCGKNCGGDYCIGNGSYVCCK